MLGRTPLASLGRHIAVSLAREEVWLSTGMRYTRPQRKVSPRSCGCFVVAVQMRWPKTTRGRRLYRLRERAGTQTQFVFLSSMNTRMLRANHALQQTHHRALVAIHASRGPA